MIYPRSPEDLAELDAWIDQQQARSLAEELERLDALDQDDTFRHVAQTGQGRRLFLVGHIRGGAR